MLICNLIELLPDKWLDNQHDNVMVEQSIYVLPELSLLEKHCPSGQVNL